MKQQALIPQKYFQSSFGGALKNSNPKTARPIMPSKALHVVLKSSQAVGGLSFSKYKKKIDQIIKKQAKEHSVRVYAWQSSNIYLHFVIKAKNRDAYQAFIRSLTGLIVRAVTGVQKGHILKNRFWDHRPFSRIVEGDKGYLNKKYYIQQSQYQEKGFNKDQAKYLMQIDELWRKICRKLE